MREQGVAADLLTRDFAPFQADLDSARTKEKELTTTTKGLTGDLEKLTGQLEKRGATLGIADQLDAAQQAVDDLANLKLDAAGKGQKSIDAARNEERAQESLSDAYRSQRDAAENLSDAKAKLAQFEGPIDTRIRTLEREQIVSRVVTTPEEARQKEIDLLKFDEDAVQRRADLQKQVASAEDGVAAAAGRVDDALQGVSDAAAARRQIQVDAAAAIAGAERRAEEAVNAAGTAILKAKDDQLIGNDALAAYLTLLDGMAGKLDPGSPLLTNLDSFLAKLATVNAQAAFNAEIQGFINRPDFGKDMFPDFVQVTPSTPPPAPSAAPSIDYHPTVNVQGSDVPTATTLDTLNRKQGIRLSGMVRV